MRTSSKLILSAVVLATATTAERARAEPYRGDAGSTQFVRSAGTGDFTGDGYADYADHDLATGAFYVHANEGVFNGVPLGFSANGDDWKVGNTSFSTRQNFFSSVMLGDFDGDGFTDYAEHYDLTGAFFVRLNDRLKHGGFSAAPASPNGTTCGGFPNCLVLVADFTGDGCADYADVDVSTGTFYVHQNLFRSTGKVSFAPAGQNWYVGHTCVGTTACETLVGDFDGNGFADIGVHNFVTGAFEVFVNYGAQTTTMGRGFSSTPTHKAQMCSASAQYCQELIGDFNADGLADYADHDWTTGLTYVHLNLGVTAAFQPVGTNYLEFGTGPVLGAEMY